MPSDLPSLADGGRLNDARNSRQREEGSVPQRSTDVSGTDVHRCAERKNPREPADRLVAQPDAAVADARAYQARLIRPVQADTAVPTREVPQHTRMR